MFTYSVFCTFSGPMADANSLNWLNWLSDKHLADVQTAGALSAQVVEWDPETRLDHEPPPLLFEVRYLFASQAAFMEYEELHAPRLRAEGLARFPPDQLQMVYQRKTGAIRINVST